jgi:hypothetical protein
MCRVVWCGVVWSDVGLEWVDGVSVSAVNALHRILIGCGPLLPPDLRVLIDTSLVSALLAITTPAYAHPSPSPSPSPSPPFTPLALVGC